MCRCVRLEDGDVDDAEFLYSGLAVSESDFHPVGVTLDFLINPYVTRVFQC